MVLASIAGNIVRYTLGAQAGELELTAVPPVAILNSAQELLCNMRPWRWLRRHSVPLSFLKDQPWVDLPQDFRELIGVQASQSQTRRFMATGIDEILSLRTGTVQTTGLFSTYFAVETAVPETKNLLGATENFADASQWDVSLVTGTIESTVAPNGLTTADTLTSTNAAGRVTQGAPASRLLTGRPYIASVHLKAGTATTNDLELRQVGPGSPGETSERSAETIARVTWTGGVAAVTLQDSSGDGVHEVGAEDVGDGWYRVWLAATYDADDAKPSAEMLLRIRPDTTSGLGSVVVWGAQMERYDGDLTRIAPTRYESNAGASPENFGEPVRRLAVWPTPSEDQHGALSVVYRRRPRRIISETETIEIPTWCEDLFFDVCRITARGAHEEDDGHLYARLDDLRGSMLFNDAVQQDESEQRSLGPMRGLAWQSGVVGRDWSVDRVAMP